jgi:hypothetical protein
MIRIGIRGIGEPLEATNKFLPPNSSIVSLDFIKGEVLAWESKAYTTNI